MDALKEESLHDLRDVSTLKDLNITNWGSTEVARLLTRDEDQTSQGYGDYKNVRIPFISSEDYYIAASAEVAEEFSKALNTNVRAIQSTDLNLSGSAGIVIEDLRPAVRVTKIVEAVEEKYGLNFVGDFFTETNSVYSKLFLHCNNTSGKIDLSDSEASGSTPFSAFTHQSGADWITDTNEIVDPQNRVWLYHTRVDPTLEITIYISFLTYCRRTNTG